MKFTVFTNLLFPVIGTGNSTHAFSKSILEALVTDEGQDVLNGLSKNTYKAYFNGSTEITKLAQKISAYIEPEEFIGYIKQFQMPQCRACVIAFKNICQTSRHTMLESNWLVCSRI